MLPHLSSNIFSFQVRFQNKHFFYKKNVQPDVFQIPFFLGGELVPLDRVPVDGHVLMLVGMPQPHPSETGRQLVIRHLI